MARQYQEDVNVLRASISALRDEPARNRTHRDDSIVFKLDSCLFSRDGCYT